MKDWFKGRWFFLSNFYPCDIKHKGIIYPSTEHYYVAQKFKGMQFYNGHYFTEPDFKELLCKVKKASDVKKMGRTLKNRSDWDSIKYDVMEWGVRYKFSENDNLKKMILSTGDENLVEFNFWHDNYWGSCTCVKCGDEGVNNLGKLLMQIREELKPIKQPSFEDRMNEQFWKKKNE